jgi:hypothetical protein
LEGDEHRHTGAFQQVRSERQGNHTSPRSFAHNA